MGNNKEWTVKFSAEMKVLQSVLNCFSTWQKIWRYKRSTRNRSNKWNNLELQNMMVWTFERKVENTKQKIDTQYKLQEEKMCSIIKMRWVSKQVQLLIPDVKRRVIKFNNKKKKFYSHCNFPFLLVNEIGTDETMLA